MTAQADILYLPILTPARVEASPPLARPHSEGTGEQTWRQRLHRVHVQPRPAQSMVYGPDGHMSMGGGNPSGRLVDLFA